MPILRFASGAFPAKERAAAIQDIWAPVTKIDIAPVDGGPFVIDAAAFALQALSIGWGRFSGYRAHRTRRHAADSSDDLVFCLVTDASWSARKEGGEEVFCEPGEIFLSVARDPSVANVPGPSNTVLNFAIPRAILAPAVVDIDPLSNAKLPSSPASRLMMSYVLALTREAEAMSPAVLQQCMKHVHDLAALVLGANRDVKERARRGGLRAARLAAIKADIVANIGRPDLSLSTIAARHGISPHYVRALFAGQSTNFSDFVRETRLARMHRLVTSAALADRHISDLAYECGFGDLSYFNRLFRRSFGMTPSEARADALKRAGE